MLNITVSDTVERASAELEGLKRRVRNGVVVRALNRTATTVRASAARTISRQLGGAVKVREVRKEIRLTRAKRDQLRAVLTAVGRRRIPLSAFRPRQLRKGVSFRLGKKRVSVLGAFITPSGAVRMRTPTWKAQMYNEVDRRKNRLQRGDKPDLPIAQIYGPGVPAVFAEPEILNAQAALAQQRFGIEFQRELKFAMTKG